MEEQAAEAAAAGQVAADEARREVALRRLLRPLRPVPPSLPLPPLPLRLRVPAADEARGEADAVAAGDAAPLPAPLPALRPLPRRLPTMSLAGPFPCRWGSK